MIEERMKRVGQRENCDEDGCRPSVHITRINVRWDVEERRGRPTGIGWHLAETLDRLGQASSRPPPLRPPFSLPSHFPVILPPPVIGPRPRRYRRPDSGPLVRLRRRSFALGSTLNGPCMVYATDTDQGRGGPTVGYRRAVVPKRGRGTSERRAGKCSSPMANSFSCFVPSLHACHWRRVVGKYECTFNSRELAGGNTADFLFTWAYLK